MTVGDRSATTRRAVPPPRSERDRLLTAAEEELSAGRPVALATVVSTRGSTYRRAGARLLVRGDGTWVGNLSGGCLEGEVLGVGAQVMDEGAASYVEYDLTADEEAIWGWGLGCNGVIGVLVEPPRMAEEAVAMLRRGDESGRPYVLATLVSGPRAGAHLLLLEDGSTCGSLGEATEAVVADGREALRHGRTSRTEIAGHDMLIEVSRPPIELVVCGAGHDAVPLVRFGAHLGWRTVVVDDRSRFLTHERFPDADELVRAPPEGAAAAVDVDDRSHVVVMSHDFLRDAGYLAGFLGTEAAYVGMLGPAQRLARLLDHLAKAGVQPSAADLAKLHGPAGLDLGADGPDEIAWAICGEILASSRGRGGGHLRDRTGPIHPPAPA